MVSPTTILLLQLLAGFGLASVCFLCGVPLGGWQFWTVVGLSVAFAFMRSRRTGWQVVGLNALVFVLTLFTFTYIHCDASTCHLPMARFMEDGWNPVREPTLAAVYAHWSDYGITAVEDRLLDFHSWHLIADPKFVQVLAAQMQAGCRLFTAAGYPLWVLFFALAAGAWRLAREVFGCSPRASLLLPVLLCCNVELTYGSFRGQVDFVTYAAVVLAGISLLLWRHGRRADDLTTFFAALIVASVSKFNGLCASFLLLALAVGFGRECREMKRGLVLFLVSLLVFGILPYGASAWWYGSPLFPAHTFRTDVALPELTGDFEECNAAAAQMGYFARMVYAYVSPHLATWGCRLWYGDPSFAPAWSKAWIACGYGPVGCLLVWSGLVVALFNRRRDITLVIGVLFLSFFLVPTKYIGFPRYVAQVHAAVALAWFAFACRLQGERRRRVLKGCAVVAVALACLTGFHFLGQLRLEGYVQRNIARMKRAGEPYALWTNGVWPKHQETWAYVMKDRCAADGYDLSVNGPGRRLTMDFQMIMSGPGLHPESALPYGKDFPIPLPVWRRPR